MARRKTTRKQVSKTLTERRCESCGKTFWAERSTRRFCSDTCRKRAQRKKKPAPRG